jgi:hypothetical protein
MIITDLNYMEVATAEVQGAAGASSYLDVKVKGLIGEAVGETYASAGRSKYFFGRSSGAEGGTKFAAGVVGGVIKVSTGSSAGA